MRLLLTTIALVLSCPAAATEPRPDGSFFAVIVSDVETSAAWYRDTLGLETVNRLADGQDYDVILLAGPGLFVELLQLTEAASRPEGYTQGLFKTGFQVPDIKAFVEALPESVVVPDIIEDERNAVSFLQLRDPDGNIVQVMEAGRSPARQETE